MKPTLKKSTVLLFNPWIYDFAAYDFWYKPLGLLYLGALLRQAGFNIQLVDCMDRFQPQLLATEGGKKARAKADGSGHFVREEITKPAALRAVPRRYSRYGMPPQLVESQLRALSPQPDVILLTSFMTYWYPGVADAARMLRRVFPKARLFLGGVYASLCPEHAREQVRPDEIITGESENALLAELGVSSPANEWVQSLDELPFPAFDMYPELRSIAVTTSRGCPMHCSFCASKQLSPQYRRRSPENVIAELDHWRRTRNVRQVAFYDDALLHRRERYIQPILEEIIARKWNMQFHTPNGLTPGYTDRKTAELFYRSGVKTIRLSFESSNPYRQQKMAKVTNDELAGALENLFTAGYNAKDIGVYILMGLPDQDMEEARQSVEFVHQMGAQVKMASFSPIPGTADWQTAIYRGLWRHDDDLLLGNTTLHPLWARRYGRQATDDFLSYTKILNRNLLNQRGSC